MTDGALYAGELHYWRHDRDEWPELLSESFDVGLRVISTCVPWSVHEVREGRYRFDDNFDIAAFVEIARSAGLAVRLRLGPVASAQITGHGIPERVLGNVACQALSGRGTPLWLPLPTKMFPAPSFASKAFQHEVTVWFATLGEQLESSEVIATVESGREELGRIAAFDGDYHEDAIEWWLECSGGLPAPRSYDAEDMPRMLAWVRFAEEYEDRSRQWLIQAVADAGMQLAPRSLPRFALGGAPWFPPQSDETQKYSLLSALSDGTQAFTLSMTASRERWSGCALETDWVRPLLAALHESEFHALTRKASIVLIRSRAEERAALASCAVEGVPALVTDYLGLGPAGHSELALDESARLYPRWFAVVREALDLAEVPYRVLDEHQLHEIDASTKAVILPTLRRVDGATWAALHALDAAGMQIIIGPELPQEDELGKPLGTDAAKPSGAGVLANASLHDVLGLAQDLLGVAGEPLELWLAPCDAPITCTVFHNECGDAKLLFVHNRSNGSIDARVNVATGCVLRDPLASVSLTEHGGTAVIPMKMSAIRIFLIEESKPC